jgi:hypothetical protein
MANHGEIACLKNAELGGIFGVQKNTNGGEQE